MNKIPLGPDITLLLGLLSFVAIAASAHAHIRKPVNFYDGLGPMRMNVDKSANEVNNQDREYEDFPQEPTFLQASYIVPDEEEYPGKSGGYFFKPPTKRYLGIEIPDYVSSPSKGSLLKTIQNR